jgi:hypothetical protein
VTITFRKKIADWISGGAITMANSNADFLREDRLYWIELSATRREALMNIITQETPYANATVRRMVKIAKEALYD